jgi:tetratricopeptide (TPR) repeat protein
MLSPASPFAVAIADASLGAGSAQVAAARYDTIDQWNPFVGQRRQALRRSSAVWSIELGDPATARVRLEQLARTGLDPADLADVRDEIGAMLVDENQPAEAARLFREAYEANPTAPDAADRLIRTAQVLADAGNTDEAIAVWGDVSTRFPEERARSELGQAECALSGGKVQDALGLYQAAAEHSADTQLAAVAQLGAATCLERLGNLDEALAALDGADLPADVKQSRRASLSEHSRR